MGNKVRLYSITGLMAYPPIEGETFVVMASDYATLEAENAELRKECEAMAKNLRGKHATSGATYAHLIAERDTLRQQRDKLVKEMLWVIEDVWPLVHGLTSRRTLRDRFKHLPDLLSEVNK